MIHKTLACFFLILVLLNFQVYPQVMYSESNAYTPRKLDETKVENADKDVRSENSKPTQPLQPSSLEESTVTIPLVVLDRFGSRVDGISQDEVTVFVDGKKIPISSFDKEIEPAIVTLVLDSSPSSSKSLERMRQQVIKLIKELPPGIEVMVFEFSTELTFSLLPTTDRKKTITAISKQLGLGDGTSVYSTLRYLFADVLPKVPGRKVVVLMTDGIDTTSKSGDLATSLAAVQKSDTPIYPVWFDYQKTLPTRKTKEWAILQALKAQGRVIEPTKEQSAKGLEYLQDLAAASGGKVFSNEEFSDGIKSMVASLANRYVIKVKVPTDRRGSHPIRVRVNRPTLGVFARGSFVD